MKNILVVDDEETILITLVEWFASSRVASEFNIITASNGVEAVKALASQKIDLLITDLNMPKMDGFELLTHMNNDYKSIPIIVMSAFATPEIKDKVKNMGATLFIPKPFSFDDLEEIDFKAIVNPPPPDRGGKGIVSGISLQSFLQLINIESKTCTLTIKSAGKTGLMYLDKGDLLNAKTDANVGDKAAQEIISWNDEGLTIEIDHVCPETEKKIKNTIMSLLMEAARMADERSAREAGIVDEDEAEAKKVKEETAKAAAAMDDTQIISSTAAKPAAEEPPPIPEPPPAAPPAPSAPLETPKQPAAPVKTAEKVDLGRLDLVKVQSKLKEFSALDGFSGAVLSTANGDILQTVSSEGSEVNLEQAAVFANNILSTSHSSTLNMKMGGGSKLVQVDTEQGHMLVSGQLGLNIMLILAVSSSLGLGKIMVTKTLNEITADLKS